MPEGLASRVSLHYARHFPALVLFAIAVLCCAQPGAAQNNVVTQHYDIARTGANTNEIALTPANVNVSTFGKLFTQLVDGYVYAQPLYMQGVTMGAGTAQGNTVHNVMFIATEHDSVYAFDADTNLGANARPLWQISLLDSAYGAASGATTVPYEDVSSDDLIPEIGITGTPVIDPATGTLYVVGKTKESGTYVQRLHALDITTGGEKFGGPVVLAASVQGNGTGSSGGTLTFDPKWQNERPGLLLLNGVVYIAFGSHGDNGPWHGWILAYDAGTLGQKGAWCSTPNGWKAGIWLSGSGLAADVPDPVGHPFGRMFVPTGNGTYDVTSPNYDNSMDYGDSILRLDLSNGIPTMASNGTTVGDIFTPHNQSYLNSNDQDPASGGVLLLPDSASASGGPKLLVQAGKSGVVYLLNRDNLGGYNPNNTKDPQESAYVKTMFSMPAYWNGNLYFWSTTDTLKAFSIANGAMSATPTSSSTETSGPPGSTPTISANVATNGIVWNIKSDVFINEGREVLFAHDATNVRTTLYSSAQNVARDNPGNCVKMSVPTVINGKVYVGAEYQVSVYGLLNGATQSAVPFISPAGQSFNPSLRVTISDSTPGVQIFYTTDGSIPTTASTVYTGPITLTNSATIQAIAAGPGHMASGIAANTYTLVNQTPTPVFTPAPGEFGSAQTVKIATSVSGVNIYYTTDGSTPTTASPKYSTPLAISSTTTLKSYATLPNLPDSAIATGLYTIDQGGSKSINFSRGFLANSMATNGYAKIAGTRLRLTDGNPSEVASAWYPVQVNIQAFTTDFNFQLVPGSTPTGDGFTFTMQAVGTQAIGVRSALGYGSDKSFPGIGHSVAVKFDLYNDAGEGNNSTGLYTNGASPTLPAVTLANGVNLHTNDVFHVHITYDGATLAMTITDTSTNAVFTTSWPIDIPGTVGSPIAYLGFTGDTGGLYAVQDILNWTYLANGAGQPATAPVITPGSGSYASAQSVTITDATPGSVVYYALDGTQPTVSSTQYSGSFSINSTTTVTAMATAPGYSQSATTSSVINIAPAAATPVISPASGTYSSAQNVTITDATSGSNIYYTLDGTQPSASSTKYTAPFSVSSTTTVNAIATAANFSPSATASSVITIAPPAATPMISPATGSYSSPQTVTITDATSGSTIYYTLDGSQPSASSTQYSGSFTVSTTSTVKAVAFASGFSPSATATSVLTISQPTAATPAISPVSGTYSSPQAVTITDNTSGSTIYYTTDGSQPSTSSTQYTASFAVSTTTTVKAIATATNFAQSATATSVITISTGSPTINFASGFSAMGMQFNGHAMLNGTRLQLADNTSTYQAGSAFWNMPVSVQTFTTDFTLQSVKADGMTFTIQNAGVTAIGSSSSGLGYGPRTAGGTPIIGQSVAVKFDLYNTAGEGNNSTGLYTNGTQPTVPATTIGGGVTLGSGHPLRVHMVYDGTTLTMTITDATTTSLTFTTSWTINIPATVGGNTAYVGFTAGTGAAVIEQIGAWTYGP